MKSLYQCLGLILTGLFLLVPNSIIARIHNKTTRVANQSNRYLFEQFSGNAIASWLENSGHIVSHRMTETAGMEWPKGSGKTIDYASGLYLIGKTPGGNIRSACTDYDSEFLPGRILENGNPDDPDDPRNRIYKINKDGTGDWHDWPFELGAPALKAANGNDSLDAYSNRIPLLLGNQTLWWVMNDLTSSTHANIYYTEPMGVEVQVLIFGYDVNGPLKNVMFSQWTIINKSSIDYDSCYVGLWDDPDIGNLENDLVACDPTLGLGYCYNDETIDTLYVTPTPAFGFDFLQGPESPAGSGQYLKMTSFIPFWGGGAVSDPEDVIQAYNMMQGRASDGSFYPDQNGEPTKFVYSGDPITGAGWLPPFSADYRFLMASGPFSLKSGESRVIIGAKMCALGATNLSSVACLREADRVVQDFYDREFGSSMSPLPYVGLNIESQDSHIMLRWDDVHSDCDEPGYQFLGYKIFQLNPIGDISIAVGSFDQIDGITQITDTLNGRPTIAYFGEENGLQTQIALNWDIFTGTAFRPGYTYYFAVKIFIYNPDAPAGKRVLSNDLSPVEHVHVPVDFNPIIKAIHIAGTGDGSVRVYITNPARINGHQYQIKFESNTVSDSVLALMSDLTTNVLFSKIVLKPGQNVVDLDSLGFKLVILHYFGCTGWDDTGTRWVSGYDAGFAQFYGGLTVGQNFFGSTLSSRELVPVRIDFQDQDSVDQVGFLSQGAVYRRDLGFAYDGIGELPMAAYDIRDPAAPRRINICFVEHDSFDGAAANRIWDMGWNGSQFPGDRGTREYLFFMNSSYNEGADYDANNWGLNEDVLYIIWPRSRDSHPYIESKFSFFIYNGYGLSAEDVFQFTASLTEVKPDISNLPATFILKQNYPNPFNPTTTIEYGIHKSEFVHLEIYNIRGQRVWEIFRGHQVAGQYKCQWNGANQSSGNYFIKLQAGRNVYYRKMLLVR